MYGPGLAPQQPQRPSTAMRVVLRVIFVLLSLFSIGFLCWAALLRVAVVTRKKSDWKLFWGGVLAVVVACVFLAADDTDDFSSVPGNIGMLTLCMSALATTAYYLYADIRHYQDQQWPMGAGPAGYHPQPPAQAAYGYPHTQTAAHPGPSTAGPTMAHHHAPRHTPHPHPHPHTQPPHLARQGPYATTSPMPQDRPGPGTGIPGPAHAPAPATPANPAAAHYPPPVAMTPAQSGQPAHGRIDQVRAELDELSDYLRRQSDDPPHTSQEGRGPEGGGR